MGYGNKVILHKCDLQQTTLLKNQILFSCLQFKLAIKKGLQVQ